MQVLSRRVEIKSNSSRSTLSVRGSHSVGYLENDWPTCIFALFIFLLILFIVFLLPDVLKIFIHTLTPGKSHIQTLNNTKDQRFAKFHDVNSLNATGFSSDPIQWQRIKPMYLLMNTIAGNKTLKQQIYEKCSKMSITERIGNHECRAEWLYHLKEAKIVGIIESFGFINSKSGAFTLLLEDGRKAMFKPCSTQEEWPESEVKASHLDFALGFNRAPPSIMRNVSLEEFEQLIEGKNVLSSFLDHQMHILQQTYNYCAINGALLGAMIGWLEDLEPTETIPKILKLGITVDEIAETRKHLDTTTLTEITLNHLFFYLISTSQKLGYNEYKIADKLFTVDLDRAKWKSQFSHQRDYSVCFLCKIDISTLEKLQEANEDNSIGATLQQSLKYDPSFIVFTSSEVENLQNRISTFLSKCVNTCINVYGADDVIVK